MLQKGVSVEHSVRGLILRVGYRLSEELGIRANPYIPALDIDNCDLRLHLEARDGTWAIDIEVSVRSSAKPVVILGRSDQYGTLSRWLERAQLRRTPCLLFQFDWSSSTLHVFTPAMLRARIGATGKQSLRLDEGREPVEDQLYTILSTVAAATSEMDARRQLG